MDEVNINNERDSMPYATTSFFRLADMLLTDIMHGRATHGCGTISAQDGSGNKEVVVAGDRYDDTVDIYSIADDSWRRGNIQLLMSK